VVSLAEAERELSASSAMVGRRGFAGGDERRRWC